MNQQIDKAGLTKKITRKRLEEVEIPKRNSFEIKERRLNKDKIEGDESYSSKQTAY